MAQIQKLFECRHFFCQHALVEMVATCPYSQGLIFLLPSQLIVQEAVNVCNPKNLEACPSCPDGGFGTPGTVHLAGRVLCLAFRTRILFGDSCPDIMRISTSHKHLKKFVHRNVKSDLVLNRMAHYSSVKITTFPMIKRGIKCVKRKCQNYNKRLYNLFSYFILLFHIHVPILI